MQADFFLLGMPIQFKNSYILSLKFKHPFYNLINEQLEHRI